MVQTVNVKSDSTFEINFGSFSIVSDTSDVSLPADLISKISEIVSDLLASGASEIHSEKQTMSSFEHIRQGSNVISNDLGTTISESDFDWIMDQINSVEAAMNQALVDPVEIAPDETLT